MIERRKGHVESVVTVKEFEPHFAQFNIQIDFDEYVVFYDPSKLLEFVNKDVYYTTRPDIVDGRKVEVVCEIALVTEVVTLNKNVDSIKLIPFDVKRPVCNFNIKDVKQGEYKVGCIAILVGMQKGESRKATWVDCQLIDAYGQLFDLRMFTNVSNVDEIEKFQSMLNGYVEFDIESTRYGYQTASISSLPQDIEQSPEIAIAKAEVMKFINSDSAVLNVVTSTGLETALDKYVDTEPGYLWVRIASELYLINTLDNITSGINIQTLRRATVLSRLYALPHNVPWSNSFLNVAKLLKFSDIIKDEDLRSILDIFYKGDTSATRMFYFKVREVVDTVIKLRRGLEDEEKNYGRIIDEFNLTFNGLL